MSGLAAIDRIAPSVSTKNWDSYNADPVTPRSVEQAKKLVPILPAIVDGKWQVVPTNSGGFEFECGDTTIHIWTDEEGNGN